MDVGSSMRGRSGTRLSEPTISIPRLLQTHTTLRHTQTGNEVCWTFTLLDKSTCGRTHNHLLALGYMLDLMKRFVGEYCSHVRATVEAPSISDRGAIREVFACEIEPGRSTSVIFSTHLLASTLGRAAPAATFVPPKYSELICSSGIRSSVETLIDLSLLTGYPRVDWISDKLGYSRRSFQRTCQREGFTFNGLVESILSEKSCDLLSNQSLSVTEVAGRLGYSDVAHFSRAFKNWKGVSPRMYRNVIDQIVEAAE